MARSRLAPSLALLGVVLVGATTVGLTLAAERLLERLGRSQALARVALAGSAARAALEQEGATLSTTARLLAARSSVREPLARRDLERIADLLGEAGGTDRSTGAAVTVDGRLLRRSSPLLPWSVLRDALPSASGWGFAADGDTLYLLAAAGVEGVEGDKEIAGATVLLARQVDPPLLAELAQQVGLPVTLVARREALSGYGERHAALLARVVADGVAESMRSEAAGCFCALEPLRLADGTVGAVLETRMSLDEVERAVGELRRRLLLLAFGLALAAALGGALFARRLAAPIARLTEAAARIESGDLETPVPLGGPSEIGTLSLAMESARRQVARLTGELARRQGEAQAVLEGISEGVFTVDRDRRVAYLNRPAAALLGLAPGEGVGRFCGDLLHPAAAPDARPCEERCPIVHARFRGASRAMEELALPGGTRPARVAAAPPVGEMQVVVLREETASEAGGRLRDALLANVSHEFKTPLAAQLAAIEMLRDRVAAGHAPESTEAETLLAALARGTQRLSRLVDNLLESIGIEAGRDAIRRREVELEEVVEEAVQQMAPLLHQRGQELSTSLPVELPRFVGDAPRLVQVLVNLLANASKFAPEGSPIRLGAEVSPEEIALFVEDRGPGLQGADPQSLFQPFVRTTGEEPEAGGVGLGLWVVRSIVERHGGRVEAHDTRTGARFVVHLPRPAA